jgi:outer membrane protein, heavy metal efflux system
VNQSRVAERYLLNNRSSAIRIFKYCIIIASIASGGCAQLSPRDAYPVVRDVIQEQGSVDVLWRASTTDDTTAHAAIDSILSAPLSADAAARLAMLANPRVQASFEELGIAQADLVRAGLLSNPVFSVLLRFPDAGGGTNIELGLSQNLLELLTIQSRQRVASGAYEQTQLHVSAEIIAFAGDARTAYYEAQWAVDLLAAARLAEQASAASVEASRALRRAGNISELSLASEEAAYADVVLEVSDAEAEVNDKREALVRAVGLSSVDANRIIFAERLPGVPDIDVDVSQAEELAVEKRLDMRIARSDVETTALLSTAARRFAWLGDDADVGVDTERDVDGSWLTGPSVSLPIPIFDTGAAGAAAADARHRQARLNAEALERQVRSEARAAVARLNAAGLRVRKYQSEVLPLRERVTAQTQLQYNAMQVGVFDLLRARSEQIHAGRAYISAIRDYWQARVTLDRVVGGAMKVVK